VLDASGAEVVTMAIRRVRFDAADDGIRPRSTAPAPDPAEHLSGVRHGQEAIFAAELAREALQNFLAQARDPSGPEVSDARSGGDPRGLPRAW
jgi:thiazole synthase ThiGH ThiG subunit